MYPVIATLELFGSSRSIGGYGALLTCAVLVFAGLTLRAGVRAGLDPGALVASLAVAVAAGAVAAYLLSAAVHALQTGQLVEALENPALTFYGGLLGGAVGLALAARLHGLPPLSVLACAVGPLALAHALGRVGCLLGGCCYGARHDGILAVRFTHPLAAISDGLPRHPVQLYEAAGLLGLAIPLLAWSPGATASRAAFARQLAVYACGYAALRFGVELVRGDPVRGLWFAETVSTSQLLSILLLAIGVAFAVFPWAPTGASSHGGQAPVHSSA